MAQKNQNKSNPFFREGGKMKLGDSYRLRIISQNTPNISDLIDDCLDFLRTLRLDRQTEQRLGRAERKLKDIENTEDISMMDKCRKQILFRDIFEILEDIAPHGCYFGSHPIDHALIGFWDKALFSATR